MLLWRTVTSCAVRRWSVPQDYAVAASGWLGAIAVRTGEGSLLGQAGTFVGVMLIVTGALATATFAFRHRAELPDADFASITSPPGLLGGSGERVIELVRDHPVPACIVTAAVAAASAMAHAETTVLNAVPWGLGEAAAVVAAFVLLGPRLGLRDGQAGAGAAVSS